MDYAVSKETVEGQLLGYMPDKFAGHGAGVFPANKTNGVLDGLGLLAPGGQDVQGRPVISTNRMYEGDLESGDLEMTLEMSAAHLADAHKRLEGAAPELPMGRGTQDRKHMEKEEKEVTIEGLAELMQSQVGEFIVHVTPGEGESNGGKTVPA